MKSLLTNALLILLFFFACSSENPLTPGDPSTPGSGGDTPTPPAPVEIQYASKPLNQCESTTVDWMHPYLWSSSNFTLNTYGADKKEGQFCYYMGYTFNAQGTGEFVFFRQDWNVWRSDLSFEPLGISFWIKGNPSNAGKFRFALITDSKLTPGLQISREEYEYCSDNLHKNADWQKVLIQYSQMKPAAGTTVPLQLDKVIAYRIEFVNKDNVAKGGNFVFIDDIRQETTFDVEAKMNKNARFSSVFIQLVADYANKDAASWESSFRDLMSVGINEMIVQYAVNDKNSSGIYYSWYADKQVSWATLREPIIDKIIAGAERCGFHIVLGAYGGGYGESNDQLIAKNKAVIDDIYRRFGASPAFTGWYIAQEFYDYNGWERPWLSDPSQRNALADYNQTIAAYCKSKKNVPVMIAPALWRGMPAKMCGEWFDQIFARTPSVDILYLQDCGGRGDLEVTCPTVDLPNWYKYIKEACDKHGVKFGVDLESFHAVSGGGSLPRDWDYLKYQLYVAGMYTNYITNFSWVTFRPGDQNFEEYRKSLTK